MPNEPDQPLVVRASIIVPSDINQLERIDYECFDEEAKDRKYFSKFLLSAENPDTGGYVSRALGVQNATGYVLVRERPDYEALDITRLAVLPMYRRQGHASELIHQVMLDLPDNIPNLRCLVPEDNLPMQLLLRGWGFLAKVKRKPWKDKDYDGYLFTWSVT